MNQQQQNHRLKTGSRSHLGGFNAFNWHQIFALDYVVVKTQKLLSSHGGFLAYEKILSN